MGSQRPLADLQPGKPLQSWLLPRRGLTAPSPALAAQDIVTASSDFNIDAFIPKLRQYLTVIQASKRQFLISWISVLASVPDIDMLAYLPHLLGGLMALLADPAQEIRQSVGKVLQVSSGHEQFLNGIHERWQCT